MRREERQTAATLDKGHGRIERRTLTSSTALNGYLDWPGVGQVFRLERERTVGGRTTVEVVYGITSLTRAQADAGQLLALVRGHWGIENRLHWVKDVVLGEDACRVRSGRGPQVLSGSRNATLCLLHQNGLSKIASALRHLAAFPMKAVQLVTQGRITDL